MTLILYLKRTQLILTRGAAITSLISFSAERYLDLLCRLPHWDRSKESKEKEGA